MATPTLVQVTDLHRFPSHEQLQESGEPSLTEADPFKDRGVLQF